MLGPLTGTTIAAGPGRNPALLPPAVLHVTSLRQATAAVAAATVVGG